MEKKPVEKIVMIPLKDGEPWLLKNKSANLHQCCDCNLVHRFLVEIKNGKIELRFYRDEYLTKKEREKTLLEKKL